MFKNSRRTHSTIDKLPRRLKTAVHKMFIDNIWPGDFQGEKAGKPKYSDIAAYVQQQGHAISVYAIGRYCRRLRTMARLKEAAELVRHVMEDADGVEVSETQKAVAELLTARIIELVTTKDKMGASDIRRIAEATKHCTHVAIAADKYIHEKVKKNIQKANANITKIGHEKQIAPEALKAIKEQVYGIIDDHLGIKR
jgi:uncharacterized protein DUF3486